MGKKQPPAEVPDDAAPTAENESLDLSHIQEPLRPLAVELSSLTLDPANAMTHGDRNLKAIADSLRQFGQDQPLVVQKQGRVVRKGNGRMQAALSIGWTHMAAVIVDENDVQAVSRAIADNRSSELSEWDYETLAKLTDGLRAEGVNVEELGWTEEELKAILDMGPTDEPTASGDESPEGFQELDENIETQFQCPSCQYKWSGSSGGQG